MQQTTRQKNRRKFSGEVSCMATEPTVIQMNNKSPFIKENIELAERKKKHKKLK